MAATYLKSSKRKVLLDARPDRPDLRDRMYQPPLLSLPPQFPPPKWLTTYLPKYRKAGLILDQGEEGACTGFGLAAVVNYLYFRSALKDRTAASPLVSMRMLYHLARKYDEWPGEDYDGSSCRGALKGWFHHGVCSDELWPYRNEKGDEVFVTPDPKWQADAAQRPIGAYYRVTTDAIADMQAAIREVGAIYVSSDVHKGWDAVPEKSKTMPTIPWKPSTKPDGGHAYALVGYDAGGFIVQNSWGGDWGHQGFARLTYDDWLDNGDDAWVAVLGAPIHATSPAIVLSSSKSVPRSRPELGAGLVNGATAEAVARDAGPKTAGADRWDTKTAVDHTIILGNDGLPDHVTVEDEHAAAAVARVTYELPTAWLKTARHGGRRVAVYVHGGLNDLTVGLARVKVMGPWFERNGIYPIFVAWQSGYVDAIKDTIADLIGNLVSQARGPKQAALFAAVSEARDYLIERAAILPARPVWTQMKQNSMMASNEKHGMAQLALGLQRLKGDHPSLEVHLVGHSAGSIVLGAFFQPFGKIAKLAAATVSLYAPACTVDFAAQTFLPAAEDGIIDPKRVFVDVLSEANERKDSVGPYGKSLLYLVSRALESTHKTPILGMEAVWKESSLKKDLFAEDSLEGLNAWRRRWLAIGRAPDVLDDERILEELPNLTSPAVHGCFDNWITGVERTIGRILGIGAKKIPVPITSLRGF